MGLRAQRPARRVVMGLRAQRPARRAVIVSKLGGARFVPVLRAATHETYGVIRAVEDFFCLLGGFAGSDGEGVGQIVV